MIDQNLFLQDKVTVFEMMMITMDEVNRDKTKVPDYYFFFVMFRLSVLLLNSMSKLIHNQCTYISLLLNFYGYIRVCKRTIILCLCLDILIPYSLLFNSEIILKQLFPSGSVNIVE